MLELDILVVGPVETNCYIVSNNSKEALVIDPGDDSNKIISFLDKKGLKPLAILITHGHFDHIDGADGLRRIYNIPLYVHEEDEQLLYNANLNCSLLFNLPAVTIDKADELITKDQELKIGDFNVEVVHLPGHTPGHVLYIFKEMGWVFCGDVVFEGSVGRTDFPLSNTKELFEGIKESILTLPSDYTLYPGHGNKTTVGKEYETNPFFSIFRK